jgi:N-acetylglucosamine-6-phosphate deacetylase
MVAMKKMQTSDGRPSFLDETAYPSLATLPLHLWPAEIAGFSCPGLIDIHVHGAYGWDFSQGDPEKINLLLDKLLANGIVGVVATLITCPEPQRLAALRDLRTVIETRRQPPFILGIYLEGPFLSEARRGSHPKELLETPCLTKVEKWQKHAGGHIKIITIAPELDGALPCIDGLPGMGILPAIGHTDADQKTTEIAINLGATHVTHLFNAMRPFSHRDPTSVSAALSSPTATVEVIGDSIHVSPDVVRLVFQTCGERRIALISDGVCPMGFGDGVYPAYGVALEMKAGKCTFVGGHLFGGGMTLDHCLAGLRRDTGLPVSRLMTAMYDTPARILTALRVPLAPSDVYFSRDLQWLATHHNGTWRHAEAPAPNGTTC